MKNTKKKLTYGPNDVRCVVWAYFRWPCTYLLIRTYRCNKFLVSIGKKQREKKKNSPRAQTMCLASFGPVFTVLAQPDSNFNIRSYIYNIALISIQDIKEKIKKYSPMAQTTPDALFGPVFIVSAHPVVYLVIRTCIYNKTFS